MRMTIDVWEELPVSVQEQLEYMGNEYNTETDKDMKVWQGNKIDGYLMALKDMGAVKDENEARFLRAYVYKIGKEKQA